MTVIPYHVGHLLLCIIIVISTGHNQLLQWMRLELSQPIQDPASPIDHYRVKTTPTHCRREPLVAKRLRNIAAQSQCRKCLGWRDEHSNVGINCVARTQNKQQSAAEDRLTEQLRVNGQSNEWTQE